MFAFLSNFFTEHGIDTVASLPLSECRVLRPYLLERTGIRDGSALMLAVPYYSADCARKDRNLSAYAVPRDYHVYFEELFGELLPLLRERFPQHRFAAFYDHSPIAEVEAAARAGLGCIGDHHLLLTERYSSYVFLAELLTDAQLPAALQEPRLCEHCGRCRQVCPMAELGECLSAVTQKKGDLTLREQEALRYYRTAWGCDLCQEACPFTLRALRQGSIFTTIPYFQEKTIAHLSTALLDQMSDEEFSHRAFSWRGRAPIARNTALLEAETSKETEEHRPC